MHDVKGIISDIKKACVGDDEEQEVPISTRKELEAILNIVLIGADTFNKVYFEELKKDVDSIKTENVTNVLVSKSGESGIVLSDLVKGYGLQRLPALWGNFTESCIELDKLLKTLVMLSEEGTSKDAHSGSPATDDDPKDDE